MTENSDIPHEELRIERLSKIHNLSIFDGINTEDDKDLDEFLKNDALKYQEEYRTAITYLCIYKDVIVGYMTLSADCVKVEEEERKEIEEKFPYDFPAIKIARLLIHKDYRGRNIGTFLVLQAVKLGLLLSEKVGMRLITVDAKKQSIKFYEGLGFKPLLKYSERPHPSFRFDLKKSNVV